MSTSPPEESHPHPPGQEGSQEASKAWVVRILKVARDEAARQVRDCRKREEVADWALHLLWLRICRGDLPTRPEVWLRVVIRSLATKRKRHWQEVPLESGHESEDMLGDDEHPHGEMEALRVRFSQLEYLLLSCLTPRQASVFGHLRDETTIKGLARVCGMQPRDVRQIMREIIAKAQMLLG